MRFLPLGLFLMSIGFFMMGASTAFITAPGTVGGALPLIGSGLAIAGYFFCRPALTIAKAEAKRFKAQSPKLADEIKKVTTS